MSTGTQNGTVIEMRNVAYRFPGGPCSLNDLNLQVRRGETLMLLGRSGSGKTTTLKLINDLLSPTEGDVLVEGRATRDWDRIRLRRGIGYCIQEAGLFPHFTVERNIGLVPTIENWQPERIRKRVTELLQLVGLDPALASRYPKELSGGQRQRVGVARALAADPPILLMDEPFGALDAITRAELQKEFLALQQRLQKTVVFVTHDLREALVPRHAHRADGRRTSGCCTITGRIHEIARPAGSEISRSIRNAHTREKSLSMNVFQFIVQNHGEVLELTLEHLWMVVASTSAGGADRYPARHFDQPPSRLEQGCTGQRQRNPDHSEPGTVRIPAACAVDRRAFGASRDSGLDPLRPVAPDSQHIRRHQRRRPCGCRSGPGHGHDRSPIAVSR